MSVKTSQFEEAQFTRILEVLKRERQAITLSPFNRSVFFFFSLAVLMNVLVIITAFALRIFNIYPPTSSFTGLDPLGDLFVVSFLITPVLLVMNIPLIIKIMHQNRLWRQLGLREFLKEKRQARRGLSKLLSVLCIGVGIIGVFFYLWLLYQSQWGIDPLPGNYFLISLLIGGGISFVALPFLRFGKEQLVWLSELASELDNIEASLLRVRQQAREEGINGIKIAPDDLKRLVVVEQSVIRQDRELAISSFRKKEIPGYIVLKSLESTKALANLDLENRLRVEEEIQHLAEDPQPQEAGADPTGGFWRRPVPETPFQILYSVDQAKRQVKIVLVETLSDQVLSAGNGGGHHA